MGNPTEKLRAMLDERGIEYTTNDFGHCYDTIWDGGSAAQLTRRAGLMMCVTPEQAIAATVGAGTCHIVKTWADSDYNEGWRYTCSECGFPIEVGERDPETGDVISAANFCWNCGARIEVSE